MGTSTTATAFQHKDKIFVEKEEVCVFRLVAIIVHEVDHVRYFLMVQDLNRRQNRKRLTGEREMSQGSTDLELIRRHLFDLAITDYLLTPSDTQDLLGHIDEVAKYVKEFRARWVGGAYSSEKNDTDRALKIRDEILRVEPRINKAYKKYEGVRAALTWLSRPENMMTEDRARALFEKYMNK